TTWTPYTAPFAIGDLLVESADTIYVGNAGAGQVAKSTFSGWTWSTAVPTGGGPVFSMTQGPDGAILVGDTAGNVTISTDGGVSFSLLGGPGAGNVVTAFDAGYGTSNLTIYAGSSGAAGIWRADLATIATAGWTQLDAIPGGAVQPAAVVGLVVAPDGTLYAADPTAAAANAGGVVRTLDPTTPVAAGGPTFEFVSTGDGLTAGYTLGSLTMVEGSSNVLLAIETSGNRVVTYTDTLSTVTPEMTVVPGAGAITFSWTMPTGATSVDVRLNTRADWLPVTMIGPTNTALPFTTFTQGGLATGTTYYWQARVSTPVLGPWTDPTNTATTTLATPGGTGVAGVVPALGATGVSITPTLAWPAVAGAASYDVQVAAEPDSTFTSPIVDTNVSTNTYEITEPLEYFTKYYWRVRSRNAGADGELNTEDDILSAWTTSSFTTEEQSAPAMFGLEPDIESPAFGAENVSRTPTLTWTPIAGATYDLEVSTDSTFATTVVSATGLEANIYEISEPLEYGTKYFWRVRAVTATQTSAWTASSFTTEEKPAAPTILQPALGAEDVSIRPTFTWTEVPGATYEFVLAEDLGLEDPFEIIDYSATADINAHVAREELKYSTTYYWRVRAVVDGKPGPWVTGLFTTMAKPEEPPPPVEVVQQPPPPAPEITLEIPPSPPPVQVIPDYLLWVIIAVGAVLVIAVIVLIVRTRRVA
ncbi:MAG: hypothetical protein JRD89_16710, partial [Deltaproteobacteria bacterium]|nr:hypothetical protein [Deltaproteobacteria bacterium]